MHKIKLSDEYVYNRLFGVSFAKLFSCFDLCYTANIVNFKPFF